MPPAWEPRELATPANAYGRHNREIVEWDRSDPSRYAAAYMQEQLARSLSRRFAEPDGLTLRRLADHVDESPDYLRSKLHGHRPASLVSLMDWAEFLGVDLNAAVAAMRLNEPPP